MDSHPGRAMCPRSAMRPCSTLVEDTQGLVPAPTASFLCPVTSHAASKGQAGTLQNKTRSRATDKPPHQGEEGTREQNKAHLMSPEREK